MTGKIESNGIAYGILILVLFLLPAFLGAYYTHLAIIAFLYVILTSSLRTIYMTGQLSLGHAAFMGIGAYVSAILAKHLGWSPWCTIPIGALSSTAAALVVGFPFSRVRAIYFSMASLFFGALITALTGLFPNLTGYIGGLQSIPRLLGYAKTPYYYLYLILTLVSLLVLYRIEHSRVGMTFRCVAQSYLAASVRGIDEAGARIRVLCIGAFFAGLAGGCYAHYTTFISPSNFSILPSVFLVIYMLVGGTRSFAGPVLGAVILYFIPYAMGGLKEYAPFFLAGVLAVVVYLIPQGIVSLPDQIKSWIGKTVERRASRNAS